MISFTYQDKSSSKWNAVIVRERKSWRQCCPGTDPTVHQSDRPCFLHSLKPPSKPPTLLRIHSSTHCLCACMCCRAAPWLLTSVSSVIKDSRKCRKPRLLVHSHAVVFRCCPWRMDESKACPLVSPFLLSAFRLPDDYGDTSTKWKTIF